MRVSEFDFDLPQDRVALQPVEPRDAARLLLVDPAAGLRDLHVHDLTAILTSKDVLVVNDTRVIPARLRGLRRREASAIKVEAMLHKRQDAETWLAFARPVKKLAIGDVIIFGKWQDDVFPLSESVLEAIVQDKLQGGEIVLRFSSGGTTLDGMIAKIGEMPLPPYIASKRRTGARDERDYQTIFAAHSGAVASPTAGLHFTDTLLDKLKRHGVQIAPITLHVGAGTFLPVTAEDTSGHQMHSEYGEISEKTAGILNNVRKEGGRIISVGTTSLRVLEASVKQDRTFSAWRGDIDLFITPGFVFRAVDVLMTNFHLPKSTLFMLVSAFSGLDLMREAYQHAIDRHYRFYSYGDACLLFPERPKA
jgi:S-adenosylmethionine:tRNA ribosyltransferase-isomerase